MFVNNVRDIGQCRVIIIITIIIITLFTVMKSGAPLLGLAKYIYIYITLSVQRRERRNDCAYFK